MNTENMIASINNIVYLAMLNGASEDGISFNCQELLIEQLQQLIIDMGLDESYCVEELAGFPSIVLKDLMF